MSWSELERMVELAERDGVLRRALSHCRSARELLLASQRLGFAIEPGDLRLARRLHQRQTASDSGERRGGAGVGQPIPLDRCG